MRHSMNIGTAALAPAPERDMLAAGIDIIPDRKNNLGAKRQKRGECPTCGVQTHKVAFLGKNKPLTVEGQVYKGRCLICHPLEGYIRRPPQNQQQVMASAGQHPDAHLVVPRTLEVGYDDDEDFSVVSGITMDMRLIQGARNWDPSQGVDYESDDEPPPGMPNRRPEPSVGGDDPYADSRPDPGHQQIRPPRTMPSYTQSMRNIGGMRGPSSRDFGGGMHPRKPPPLASSGQGPGRFTSGAQMMMGKSENSLGMRRPNRDYGDNNNNNNSNMHGGNAQRMDQKPAFQEQGYDYNDHGHHQNDMYEYPNEQDEDDQYDNNNYASGGGGGAAGYSGGNGPALDKDGYPISTGGYGWNKEADMLPPGGMDSLFKRQPSKNPVQMRSSMVSTNQEIEFSPQPKHNVPAPAPEPQGQAPGPPPLMGDIKMPGDNRGGDDPRLPTRMSSIQSGPMYSDDFPAYVEDDNDMAKEPPPLTSQSSGPVFYASETMDDEQFDMAAAPPPLQTSKTTGPDVFSRFQGTSARKLGGPTTRPSIRDSQNISESSFAPPLIRRGLRGQPDDDNIQDPMSNMPTPIGMTSMPGRAATTGGHFGGEQRGGAHPPMHGEMSSYSPQYDDEPIDQDPYGRDTRNNLNNQRNHGMDASMPAYQTESTMPPASGRDTRNLYNQRNQDMDSPYGDGNSVPQASSRDPRNQSDQRSHDMEQSMPYEDDGGMVAPSPYSKSIISEGPAFDDDMDDRNNFKFGGPGGDYSRDYGRDARNNAGYGIQNPSDSYGMKQSSPDGYGRAQASSDGYGMQQGAPNDYGMQPSSSDDYGMPGPSDGYGTQQGPSDGYGMPQGPSDPYGMQQGQSDPYGMNRDAADHGQSGGYSNDSRNKGSYGMGGPKDAGSTDDHHGMSSLGSLDYNDTSGPSGSAPGGDRGTEPRKDHSNHMMPPASNFQQEESKHAEYDRNAYASSSGPPPSAQVDTMLRKLSLSEPQSAQQEPKTKSSDKGKSSSKPGTIHDIPAILHCLNLDEATANLREKALISLSEILWKSGEKARSFIVEHKGVETLVQTMWSDIGDAKVQAAALAFLFSLSASPDGRASGDMLSNEESICDTLLFSMQTHVNDPGIQLHGCAILACLASASSNNVKVSDGSLSGAVLMVVNAMSHHSRSRDIQKAGLQALYFQCLLSTNAESNKRTLIESNLDNGGSGMDALISAMTSLQDDLIAAEWACRLCWSLTSSQDMVKSLAATSIVGVISDLCQRYMPNQNAGGLMEAAFGVIANLSFLENKRSELERLGVVPILVDGLRYHPKDAGVNIEACSALANLAVSSEVREGIARSGAVESIVHAMQTFPDDQELMSEASRALVCLAIGSPESKESIAAPDVLDAINRANKGQGEGNQLLEMSCSLLASLAVNRSLGNQMVGNGAIDTIIKALGPTSDEKLREAACLAFRNLACELDQSDQLLQKGAIKGIVNAMGKHGNAVNIQINACCSFWNLAYKTEREPGTIVGTDGIKNIVKAMQSHLESGELLELACGALWSLVDDSVDRKKDVVGSGAIDAVACAVVMHPGRVSTLEKAFGVLSNVSLERPLAEAIVNAQGVSILVEAMRNNSSSIPMLEVGCTALRNLIFQFPDFAPEASSVISVIINSMKENPDAVSFQQEACNLLWVLAAEAENCQSKILALDGVAVVMKCMEIQEVQESALGAFRQLASGSNMSLP